MLLFLICTHTPHLHPTHSLDRLANARLITPTARYWLEWSRVQESRMKSLFIALVVSAAANVVVWRVSSEVRVLAWGRYDQIAQRKKVILVLSYFSSVSCVCSAQGVSCNRAWTRTRIVDPAEAGSAKRSKRIYLLSRSILTSTTG